MKTAVKPRRRILCVLMAVLAPVMMFVALASWAFASPVGASPDDDYHMASIWCGAGLEEGMCEAGASPDSRKVPAVLLEAPQCFAFDANASASCPQKPPSVLIDSTRGNFDGGYPPVFYWVMSGFAGEHVSTSILLMRLANAALFVGVTSALFFLLPSFRRGPLLWGALVSVVPLGMFLIPSVNPSSWAVTSAATLWVALLAFFTEKRAKRRIAFGAIAVLMTIAAAGARGDAAVYSVLAMIVVLVLVGEVTRKFALAVVFPVVLAGLCVFLFFSAGQSAVINPDGFTAGDPNVNLVSLAAANLLLLPQLWLGALGFTGLGWLDTGLPGLVWVTVAAIFSAMVFWGLQKTPLRKAIAVALIFASLVAVPMYILVHDRVFVGAYVQPRYIYPLMILLIGVALFGLDRLDLRLSRMQLLVIAGALTIANAVAMHVNLRRYLTGSDGGGLNLNRDLEWWWNIPVSPMVVWAVGSVAFGLVMLTAALYSRERESPGGWESENNVIRSDEDATGGHAPAGEVRRARRLPISPPRSPAATP